MTPQSHIDLNDHLQELFFINNIIKMSGNLHIIIIFKQYIIMRVQ